MRPRILGPGRQTVWKPVAPRWARVAPLALLAALIVVTIAALLAGCGGGDVPVSTNPPPVSSSPPPPPPPARTCAMQGYAGTYPACVCPLAYQTYIGATPTTAGVCVGDPPPVISLTADPSTIEAGQFTSLQWSAGYATNGCVSLMVSDGNKTPWPNDPIPVANGALYVGPLWATATFTLICNGAKESTSASVIVTVNNVPATMTLGGNGMATVRVRVLDSPSRGPVNP